MSKKRKGASYISGKESRRITKFNRKLTMHLEKQRAAKSADPSIYTTKMRDESNVVEFDNICSYFFTDVGVVRAVDGVSFNVPKRSTVGIVGESGCGKSVMSLSLMQLLQRPQGQTVGGEIRFNMGGGKAYNIVNTPTTEMMKIRGNKISMIFQEPMTSLNPVFRCGYQIDEVLLLHNPGMTKEQAKARSIEMISMVGIANAEGVYKMFPHELSGGMRQRVMIAMALACSPELIIADEPTTALDVTIQAQILSLMNKLKRMTGTAIIFITHDLGVINEMADDVAVMYCGQVVEKAPSSVIFRNCAKSHPYTEGLMLSVPRLENDTGRLDPIPGVVPHPLKLPKGCKFGPRCKYCTQRCVEEEPELVAVSDDQMIRCFYPDKEERNSAEHKEITVNH